MKNGSCIDILKRRLFLEAKINILKIFEFKIILLGILEDIWNINLKERRTKIIQKEGYQKKWFLYQRMWQNFSKDNCSDKMESDSKTISVYQIYYDLLVKMFVNRIINSRLFLFLFQDYLTASLLFFAIHKHVKYVLFLYQSI